MFSKYLASKCIDAALRGVTFTAPTAVYLALFKGTAEVAYNGYARQQLVMSAIDNSGISSNTALVRFPTNKSATAVTADKVQVFDAKTGGNALIEIALGDVITIGTNHAVEYEVNALKIDFKLPGE